MFTYLEFFSLAFFLQAIGFIGVLQIIAAYALLQFEFLESNGQLFSILNLLGAIMVLISLLGSTNYAAMTLEIFWCLISAVGLYKAIKRVSHKHASNI